MISSYYSFALSLYAISRPLQPLDECVTNEKTSGSIWVDPGSKKISTAYFNLFHVFCSSNALKFRSDLVR